MFSRFSRFAWYIVVNVFLINLHVGTMMFMNRYKKIILGLGFILVGLFQQSNAMVGDDSGSVDVQSVEDVTIQINAECDAFIQAVDDIVCKIKDIQNIAQGIVEAFDDDNSGWVELGHFYDDTLPQLLELFNGELSERWASLSLQDKNEQQIVDAARQLGCAWVNLLNEPIISFDLWVSYDQSSYRKLLAAGESFIIPSIRDIVHKINHLGLDFLAIKSYLEEVKRQIENDLSFSYADTVMATTFIDYCIRRVAILSQEYSGLLKKGITYKKMLQLGLFGLIF